MLLLCGFVQGGTAFIQSALFGYASEKLTTRLRTSLFRNIMRMDIGYFDMPTHSSGKISTRLATDTPNVKSAIDFRLGAVIAALVSIICGLSISFYYNWATSLLVLGIFPLAVLGRSLQLRYLKGSTEKDARDMEKAGNIALQGIENVRTVQSLTIEIKFQKMFLECLLGPHKQAKKDAIVQGLTYGFSSSILYFIFAACYRFGLWLILDHNTPPMYIMKVLMAVSFSMGSISFATAYIPEYKKARLAAGLIFKMLGEEPKIDSLATDGQKREIKGFVHFKDLHFVYPERPKVKILRGLDISVEPGQTLALVWHNVLIFNLL
uniref:ABC transmembrane type-1 domain-containing protein n=1 Tax=Panagrolaimus superbus TaxID=310955 RepID=A0A914YTJ0_9BILA